MGDIKMLSVKLNSVENLIINIFKWSVIMCNFAPHPKFTSRCPKHFGVEFEIIFSNADDKIEGLLESPDRSDKVKNRPISAIDIITLKTHQVLCDVVIGYFSSRMMDITHHYDENRFGKIDFHMIHPALADCIMQEIFLLYFQTKIGLVFDFLICPLHHNWPRMLCLRDVPKDEIQNYRSLSPM